MTSRIKRPEYFWSHVHDKMALPAMLKTDKGRWGERGAKVRRTQTDYSSQLIWQKMSEMKKLRSWVNAKKRVRDFLSLKQVVFFT